MHTPPSVLRASLEKHNDAFEALLKLIPAQYYIVNDDADEHVCVSSLRVKMLLILFMWNCLDCFEVPETQQKAESAEASNERGFEKSQEGQGEYSFCSPI